MYYPYGEERWHTSTLPTDYRFTDQRLDSYIKLTIMGARWYDAELGRWISPDTIMPDPKNPQSLNRYSYCRGNPVLYRDPSGHEEATGDDKEGSPPMPQPGDILLVNLDNWKIPGDWDHAAIIVFVDPENPNVVWIVEAGMNLNVWMHKESLDKLDYSGLKDWTILRANASGQDRLAAAQWAEALAGSNGTHTEPTSGDAPFISLFPGFGKSDSIWGHLDIGRGVEGYYCFEVPADAYQAQGIDITGRTQEQQMALEVQQTNQPGVGAVYTQVSMAQLLTPISGIEMFNSPNTFSIASMGWW